MATSASGSSRTACMESVGRVDLIALEEVDRPELIVGGRVVGIEGERELELLDGGLGLVESLERESQMVVGVGGVLADTQRLLELSHGILVVARR